MGESSGNGEQKIVSNTWNTLNGKYLVLVSDVHTVSITYYIPLHPISGSTGVGNVGHQ